MKKYLLISSTDEENIGVIALDNITGTNSSEIQNSIKQSQIEKKLVQALQEHFNDSVKIISSEILDTSPLTINFYVKIESLEEDYNLEFNLNETWVY